MSNINFWTKAVLIGMFGLTSIYAVAKPAESVITWGGVIPGGILGSDIGLRSPKR